MPGRAASGGGVHPTIVSFAGIPERTSSSYAATARAPPFRSQSTPMKSRLQLAPAGTRRATSGAGGVSRFAP